MHSVSDGPSHPKLHLDHGSRAADAATVRPFRCSDKFRLNANGKRLDAWLIYRCASCDNTWNRPVLERRNRRDIDPLFLHALEANDPRWIRRYAFDVASLRNRAERVEEFMDVDIEKRLLSAGSNPSSELEILLAVAVPTCLRTDRLLASELGLSRRRIEDLTAKGRLAVAGADGRFENPCAMERRIVFDLRRARNRTARSIAQGGRRDRRASDRRV